MAVTEASSSSSSSSSWSAAASNSVSSTSPCREGWEGRERREEWEGRREGWLQLGHANARQLYLGYTKVLAGLQEIWKWGSPCHHSLLWELPMLSWCTTIQTLRTILFIGDICKHLHSYLLTLVQWVVSLQARGLTTGRRAEHARLKHWQGVLHTVPWEQGAGWWLTWTQPHSCQHPSSCHRDGQT